jgi:hypothetical protein
MNFIYIAVIILVTIAHLIFSFKSGQSPLNASLVILLLSPLIFFLWKDASSIKLGAKGLELEKMKNAVDKTIKHAVKGHSIDSRSLETLFKSVEANEWITLVLSRMLMRKCLVALYPEHDFGPSPSLMKLINKCFELEKISESEKDDLEKLRHITFYAEWWGGEAPTHGDWKWAISNCQSIIQQLFDKQVMV